MTLSGAADADRQGTRTAASRPPPRVVIIVLNWNKLDETRACLEALPVLDYPNWTVHAVDNGSEVNGAEQLAGTLPNLSVSRNPANLGYAGGNNKAMAEAFAAGADYVWLLNNDAAPERTTLSSLVAVAEADPAIGLVTPVLRRSLAAHDVEAACAVFSLDAYGIEVTQSVEQAAAWLRDVPSRVAVFGTALLIKRAAYDAFGGFDERLFAYNEDIDLSIRCAAAGFRSVVDLGASVIHRDRPRDGHGDVPPHLHYYMARNDVILWAKHGGQTGRIKVLAWQLSRTLEAISNGHCSPGGARAMLAGLWDGARLSGGAYAPARRMPRPLEAVILARPSLWLSLVRALTGTPRQKA